MPSGDRWTKEDERFLIRAYPNHEIEDIATALRRSNKSVQVKASRLGVSNNHMWTPEEDAKLAELLGEMPMKSIAFTIGRPLRSCYRRVEKMMAKGDKRFSKKK